jgi:hypothetical protein
MGKSAVACVAPKAFGCVTIFFTAALLPLGMDGPG